jgi:mRNA interferase RelE/StbE
LYPRLHALGLEPLPHGATKLKGMQGAFRIRVGDYRIIYEVLRSSVRVIAVPRRRDVYR